MFARNIGRSVIHHARSRFVGTGAGARKQMQIHCMSMLAVRVGRSTKGWKGECYGSILGRGRTLGFGFTGVSTRTMANKVTMHESLEIVSTSQAPAAIGPYSQAIKVGSLVFCSGCIPLNPETMEIVPGGVEEQAQQALKNLKAVVEASGSELGKVAKVTVFLKNMNDFAAVNGIYANFFGDHKPARSAVEVARLPKDVLVEVEAIASLAA